METELEKETWTNIPIDYQSINSIIAIQRAIAGILESETLDENDRRKVAGILYKTTIVLAEKWENVQKELQVNKI